MALRFIDSFDHYTSEGELYTKWTGYFNASRPPGASVGRFGGGWPLDNNNQRSLYKTLDAQATWIIGTAVKRTLVGITGISPLLSVLDGTTDQCFVACDESTGLLKVYRGSTANLLGTGTIPLSVGVWYYLEFKVTISDAAGIAVVRLNGVTDINLSSVDTKNTANATADTIRINGGATGTGQEERYDDVYFCDGTGSAPTNDFLGDVRVQALFPNGNGNTSQLVGQDANSTDNYLNVDETPPDSDTTYNESSTVNDKDTYTYTNLTPTVGSVYGIQILPYARKTDAGVRSIKTVARHSATEVDSADFTLSTSYEYHEDLRETKPGGGAWSISDVNGAEFGVKVSA